MMSPRLCARCLSVRPSKQGTDSWYKKSQKRRQKELLVNCSSTVRRLLMLGALPLLAATINADTLVLRNGSRVQGQLITFHEGVIEFQEGFTRGRLLRFSRDEVVGLEFDRNDRSPYNNQQPPPAAGRPRGLREKQLMAAANVGWTDTGIQVNAGQTIYFEAAGEIRWGGRR